MQSTKLKTLVAKVPFCLDQGLKILAAKTGKSKSYYVRKAIERFLKEQPQNKMMTDNNS